MPRVENRLTGTVASVGDELAAKLGSEWGPVGGGAKAPSPAKAADVDAEPADDAPAPKRRGGRPRKAAE